MTTLVTRKNDLANVQKPSSVPPIPSNHAKKEAAARIVREAMEDGVMTHSITK